MNFSPYHSFQNEARLNRLIKKLHDSGNVSDALFQKQRIYHQTLLYKLKCAKHHLDRLEDKLVSAKIEEAAQQSSDFMFAVNMSIDGFFYAGGSALDILAREVLVLFGESLPNKVYYNTARIAISRSRSSDSILPRLADPSWYSHFSDYRNVATHELIVATKYSIDILTDVNDFDYKIIFPLPDDPRAEPDDRTYDNFPNVMDYAKDHMRKLLSKINTIYGDIHSRARVSGCLPL